MTISENETVDLGRLAVMVESFAPADGDLAVDVVPFESGMIDVTAASAWFIEVDGHRVSVLLSPNTQVADGGSSLVDHLTKELGGPATPTAADGWPLEGASVVAVRRDGAVEAVVQCGLAAEVTTSSLDGTDGPAGSLMSLGMLRDVPLEVSAELGRTKLSVAEILQLAVGSIVELDRPVGSPVDVVVNGSLIGRGEVVVIDDEYGVRITEILARVEDSL
ncbi:MAG: flagellar motor switch protein FliN [Acidimicrobiales bacterium]